MNREYILKVLQEVLGDHVEIKHPDEPPYFVLDVAHYKPLTVAEQEAINLALHEAGVPYVLDSFQSRAPDEQVTPAVRRLTFRLAYPKRGSWGGADVGVTPQGPDLREELDEAQSAAREALDALTEIGGMVRAHQSLQGPLTDRSYGYILDAVERALAEPDELLKWCPECRCLTGPAFDFDRPCRGKEPEGGCKGGWV